MKGLPVFPHSQRGLIGVAFLVAVSLGSGCEKSPETTDAAERGVPVKVASATNILFRKEIKLQGTLESKEFALVPAKVGGTLERILVEEGDAVEKGDVLCELDREILQRAVESQRQELSVAKKNLAVARAKEEQAAAQEKLAQKDYKRFQRLAEEEAVTRHKLEEAEQKATTTAAALKVAEEQVSLSEARVEQAETALAIAKRKLEDATVRAPIAGTISHKFHELGEMVDTGKPVFRIDNPGALEVSVFAPADYYAAVIPGDTEIEISLADRSLGKHVVSYRSPLVDDTLRTFEVKALLEPPPEDVVAGGLVLARIILQERKATGVPEKAVLTRGGKDVVFALDSKKTRPRKARKHEVETGLHTEKYVEITGGLPPDGKIIVRGQDQVDDKEAVRVVED